MKRCLHLGFIGKGNVSPNPMVGAVLVKDNQILSEGWHQQFGGNHAEVNALQSFPDKVPTGCTLYVNLEPCSHFGKTPPCADLIIQKGVEKVVIAMVDPNPLVAGKGIKALREAGIEVTLGIGEAQAKELNKRFITTQNEKRPWILLKWAQTQDGFIAREDGSSKWISGLASRTLVHYWRGEEDAIMVGSNTLRIDKPQLNVRLAGGRDPIKIILSSKMIDLTHLQHLEGETWVFHNGKERNTGHIKYFQVANTSSLSGLMTTLYTKGVGSVLIEGGSRLINSFLEADLWNEARIFTGPQSFGAGLMAPSLPRSAKLQSISIVGKDKLEIYVRDSKLG